MIINIKELKGLEGTTIYGSHSMCPGVISENLTEFKIQKIHKKYVDLIDTKNDSTIKTFGLLRDGLCVLKENIITCSGGYNGYVLFRSPKEFDECKLIKRKI